MRSDLAVFILSHGRADNVKTYQSLKKHGYSGKIYILIDDMDSQQGEYIKRFGKENVIIFDKKQAAIETDAYDNFPKLNSVLYARNATMKVAKELGLKYVWELDDDYTTFRFTVDHLGNYITKQSSIKNLDRALSYCIDFMDRTKFDCIAFSQGGDFIGGPGAGVFKKFQKNEIPRKIMNSFLINIDNPLYFQGRMNDDVNTYVIGTFRGKLYGTIVPLRLEQAETQQQSGGLTDMYREHGTYVKSFYTVMCMPSAVKITWMGAVNKRLHHSLKWENIAPKIISRDHKK